MIKIVALGTSGSTPTKERGLPSFAIIYEGDVLLFDCGEGTQMQMLKFGINIASIKAIFITHAHGDHTIGIAGLVRTMSMMSRREPLLIFVPHGYEQTIKNLLVFDKPLLNFPILIRGVRKGAVYKQKAYTISAFRLNHTIPTYGYVFKENDKRHFLEDKAHKLGIKGTMFSELERRKRIRINNRQITLGEVTWIERGKKIAYATDTRPSKNTIEAATQADVLIHEATYTEVEKKLAISRKHSTAKEAAIIARRAKAKLLLLVHISARYRDPRPVEAEARKFFRNSRVAYDGLTINVE